MTTATLQPYLFFGGRADEAIDFYRRVLGAELVMRMRYSESPDPPPPGMVPPGFENKVMHATLQVRGATLLMSDGNGQPARFDGFRLSLALPTSEDAQRAFAGLADGGSVFMPIGKTFWSPCFGMVTDRFGVGWMVTVTSEPAA